MYERTVISLRHLVLALSRCLTPFLALIRTLLAVTSVVSVCVCVLNGVRTYVRSHPHSMTVVVYTVHVVGTNDNVIVSMASKN